MLQDKLPASTAEEALLLNEELPCPRRDQNRQQKPLKVIVAILMVLCFSAGVVFEKLRHHLRPDPDLCLETSPESIGLEVAYHDEVLNGSFFQETIYRQEAGPAVDDAWEKLGGGYMVQMVSKETALSNGLNQDHLHLTEKYGGHYPSNLFFVHQIHCLNLLQQALYFNADYYKAKGEGAFVNSGRILRLHVTHCLDMLRQDIMCKADLTLVGVSWYQPKDSPEPRYFPDFNVKKKCRNFDDIRQWAEDHQNFVFKDPPEDYFEDPREGATLPYGMP